MYFYFGSILLLMHFYLFWLYISLNLFSVMSLNLFSAHFQFIKQMRLKLVLVEWSSICSSGSGGVSFEHSQHVITPK
jgi:hypothetical protein